MALPTLVLGVLCVLLMKIDIFPAINLLLVRGTISSLAFNVERIQPDSLRTRKSLPNRAIEKGVRLRILPKNK